MTLIVKERNNVFTLFDWSVNFYIDNIFLFFSKVIGNPALHNNNSLCLTHRKEEKHTLLFSLNMWLFSEVNKLTHELYALFANSKRNIKYNVTYFFASEACLIHVLLTNTYSSTDDASQKTLTTELLFESWCILSEQQGDAPLAAILRQNNRPT